MSIFPSKFETSLSGCQRLSAVATLYFPNYTKTHTAKQMFFAKIAEDKELHIKLKEVGFSTEKQFITPKQMILFFEYWGVPDATTQWMKSKL